VSFKNLQPKSQNDFAAKSTFSSASELRTTDTLREAIKDTSVIIPGSRKPIKEETLLKAAKTKKVHLISIPIEYWQSYSKRWTTEATLTVSKSKTKFFLDFNGLQDEHSLNTSEYQGRNRQRVTFFFYNLVFEHSDPLARNFLAILSGGGQILRHRIAFYSEADGNFATVLLKKFGAQIIVRQLVPPPFQIQSYVPNPWNEYHKKKLSHENERDLINDRLSQQRKSIACGENLNNPNHQRSPTTEESAMIFRRQSTGSYMDYANGKPLPDNQVAFSRRQPSPYLTQPKGWAEGSELSKIEYNKNSQHMQRKNSMTSSLRRSLSRSHSSDMSAVINHNKDLITNNIRYTTPDEENTTSMSIKRIPRDKKKYSDQSLNSHNSDEYYDEEELREVHDKEYIGNNSSEEEEDFFLTSSIMDNGNSDTIDGNIFNLKKVATHRFFSRLVEATSSFSNSTPSLPSMVKRSTILNSSIIRNPLSSTNLRNNDVELQSARFYNLTDNELVMTTRDDKNKFLGDNKDTLKDDFCDCLNEDDESDDLYEPSKMFGLINCEHKGFAGFEFDDYPEDIIQDVEKRPSFAPNLCYGTELENLSEEENEDVEKDALKTAENERIQEGNSSPSENNHATADKKYANNNEAVSCEYTKKVLDSVPMSVSISNESNNSSRNSTLSSFNWIRRSFEDLDIEVLQTEIMQKRKRKDSRIQQQPSVDRRKHALSLSSSTNSEDFQTYISSKVMPYCEKDADDCIECRRMFGQVIDDEPGMTRHRDTQTYPCDCPIVDISCYENCCSKCTSSTLRHENEEIPTEEAKQNTLITEKDLCCERMKTEDAINVNENLDNKRDRRICENTTSSTWIDTNQNLIDSISSLRSVPPTTPFDTHKTKSVYSWERNPNSIPNKSAITSTKNTDLTSLLLRNAPMERFVPHYGLNSNSTNL